MFSNFSPFHHSRGPRKTPYQTSTTSDPTTAILEPGEEDLYYVVERDGSFRPASPMSRKSSTDLDFVDAAEVMEHGAFVYIEDDSTALVFDGMEVRELHFSDLEPSKSDSIHTNVTTSSPEPVTPIDDDPSRDFHSQDFDSTPSSRKFLDVTTHSTEQPSTPETTSYTSVSPVTALPEQLRPEVQEFLSRIRLSALATGSRPTRVGGLRTLSITPGMMFYPSLVAGGLIVNRNGQWMPASSATARNTNHQTHQFDDSYYTSENDFDPMPASSPTSPPSSREPHLFYMRRQGIEPTKSPTSVPLL